MHSRDRSAATGSGFGAAVRRVLRTLVLLLVLLLVASIGLVIGKGAPNAEPSAAELALSEGAASAQALAAAARLLETSAPAVEADYEAMAEMLDLHASALRPAASTGESPSPASSPAGSPSPTLPSAAPVAPSPADFLTNLTHSYTSAFAAAAVVDAGPARVLASAATAQWLRSRALAEDLGVTVPVIPVPETRYDDGAAPNCPTQTTLTPDHGLDGARTAVLAEQRASYAYEIVAARADDPEALLDRMAAHEGSAAEGSEILAQHCLAGPLPSAAYALDASFSSGPDTALRELEAALVGTYTDLVGVSAPGPVREWALRQLAETAQGLVESDAAELEVLPGIDPAEYPRLQDPAS
ncbi:DUF4439 domain-containing protein [uncultured Arthrobacter sp.]|uniref:DUF4439 domain-containing protein n=1 Tax=uncultured Arthrobacter sp. TaxID=114050 RepID=UPI002622CC83|nr:DUF4439 domain-containing protein [uncultured Arthrobacter sp.]